MDIYLNVLSLNDNISSVRLALEKVGFNIHTYYTVEDSKAAQEIAEYNYPDNICLGDWSSINDTRLGYMPKIDLLVCNNQSKHLSSNWNQFKDIYRYLKQKNPYMNVLFECPAAMTKNDKQVISEFLNCNGVEINSSLFTAHNKRKVYWTDFAFKELIRNAKFVYLEDILEEKVSSKYYLSARMREFILSKRTSDSKWKNGDLSINPKLARPLHPKVHKLNKADVDTYVSTKFRPFGKTNVRRLTPTECERLQGLPDGYTEMKIHNMRENRVSDTMRYEAIGKSGTVDVYGHIFNYYWKYKRA